MVPTNSKTVVLAINAGTATVSTLTATVDTKGFSFAKIVCLSSSNGSVSTGTNNKLEESDDSTNTSSFATFAGFVQGTDWTGLTSANSTSNAKVLYNVPMIGRKRFLKVTFTHATGGGGTIIAELERPSNGISTAAEAFESTDVGNIIGI